MEIIFNNATKLGDKFQLKDGKMDIFNFNPTKRLNFY